MKPKQLRCPKSALAFYIKLYCNRKRSKGSTKSKYWNNLIEATKSWTSLSESEREPFYKTFKEYEELCKSHFLNQLKDAEPFMKTKNFRSNEIDLNTNQNDSIIKDQSISEIEIQNKMQTQDVTDELNNTNQDYNNTTPCLSETDLNTSSLQYNNNEQSISENKIQEVPVELSNPKEECILPTSLELKVEQRENEEVIENDEPALIEPLPPAVKSGKELYFLLNSTPEKNSVWLSMPGIEKSQYSRAVSIMKKDYIYKYKEYLQSMSSEELFNYYNRVTL